MDELDNPDIKWTSNKDGISPQELYKLITYEPGQMIHWIEVIVHEAIQGQPDLFLLNLTDPATFLEQRKATGRCWTLNLRQEIKARGIFRLEIKL